MTVSRETHYWPCRPWVEPYIRNWAWDQRLLAPFYTNSKFTTRHMAFPGLYVWRLIHSAYLDKPTWKVQCQHYNSSRRVRKLLDIIFGKGQRQQQARRKSPRLQEGRSGPEYKLSHVFRVWFGFVDSPPNHSGPRLAHLLNRVILSVLQHWQGFMVFSMCKCQLIGPGT